MDIPFLLLVLPIILWAFGVAASIGGSLIHLLLVMALIATMALSFALILHLASAWFPTTGTHCSEHQAAVQAC